MKFRSESSVSFASEASEVAHLSEELKTAENSLKQAEADLKKFEDSGIPSLERSGIEIPPEARGDLESIAIEARGLFATLGKLVETKLDEFRVVREQEKEDLKNRELILSKIKDDPLESLRLYVELPHRNHKRWQRIEWPIAKAVGDYMKIARDMDELRAVIDMYQKLPGEFDGRTTIAFALVEGAKYLIPGINNEQKRAAFKELFNKTPDILLKIQLITRDVTFTREEQYDFIRTAHSAGASPDEFRIYNDVNNELADHNDVPEDVRSILFTAFLGTTVEYRLCENGNVFFSEITSLPPKEQRRLIKEMVDKANIFHWKTSFAPLWNLLDEKQKERAVGRFLTYHAKSSDWQIKQDLGCLSASGQRECFALARTKKYEKILSPDMLSALEGAEEESKETQRQLQDEPLTLARALQHSRFKSISVDDRRTLVTSLRTLWEQGKMTEPLVALGFARELELSDSEREGLLSALIQEHPAELLGTLHTIYRDRAPEILIAERIATESPVLEPGMLSALLQSYPELTDRVDELRQRATSPERQAYLQRYVPLYGRMVKTPSQALQRIRDQVLGQLLETEQPEKEFEKIEDVFVRNNLPLIGKTYRVFEILYPTKRLKDLCSAEKASPVLRAASERRRSQLFFQDLLRVHVDSANPSLKDYLETFNNPLLEQVRSLGSETEKSLNEQEGRQLINLVRKLNKLYQESQLGRDATSSQILEQAEGITLAQAREQLHRTMDDLKVRDGQTITDRVAEMYLQPAGYTSMQEVLNRMEQVKNEADRRGREIAATSYNGHIQLSEGDLLKGVDFRYFTNILQNGSVAKEFLGASSQSDSTPLDTDVGRVTKQDAKLGFNGAIEASPAKGYGQLLFVIKDRGQFHETTPDMSRDQILTNFQKPELFKTAVVDPERHYGIRTGFASTEIDFMVADSALLEQPRARQQLFLEIVRNGYYVPVTDRGGKIIFTPELYDTYRKQTYGGLPEYNGPDFVLASEPPHPEHERHLANIRQAQEKNFDTIPRISHEIRSLIADAIGKNNLLNPSTDRVVGAEIIDSGSTGRFTNKSDGFDFDFIIKLDPPDMDRLEEIKRKINERLRALGATPNPAGEGALQLRVVQAAIGGQRNVEVDFTFVSKSEISYFESHQAASERLTHIRDRQGEKVYRDTLANIVLAKERLEKAGVYKKVDGGLGGIGVENWILQHGGNFITASRAVLTSARTARGFTKTLDTFKANYAILDPGQNAKDGMHDNFIDHIRDDVSYRKLLKALETYLNEVGVKT